MKKLKKKIHKYQDIEKDAEGYLKNNKNWNVLIAQEIAQNENINLTSDHWKIIYFVRDFYFQFNMTTSIRMLINGIQKKIKNKKINSIYLFTLFPKGPAKQASKIAGIPKPAQCL